MSNPHVPFDPTLPVDDPIARAAELDEAWDAGFAAAEDNRSGRVAGLILAAISGAVLGFFLATAIANAAAPRSAQLAIPAAVETVASGTDAGQSGAPTVLSAVAPSSGGRGFPAGAPLPSEPIITEPPAIASGLASWYDDGPGLYGAVPSWRFGDRPYQVRVRAGARSVIVTIRDFCRCPGERIIDLSTSAFRELAPLSRGVIPVTVVDLGPGLTAPPTDIGP